MKILRFCFAIFVLSSLYQSSNAQADRFGQWAMYFGQNRISDKLSIHSEFQFRSHEITGFNAEQLMIRTGLNYHFQSNAFATAGYAFIPSYTYDSPQSEPEIKEHRIWQQLITTQQLGRVKFEHRYRIEQRWVNDDYGNRFRYRLMAFLPLNKERIETGTLFLSAYDEIFVNAEKTFFDRNRLYAALGYQLNQESNVQLGWLRQALNNSGKYYLQISMIYNPDFRKEE